MNVKACCLLVALCWPTDVAAAATSLFFTPTESQSIRALQAKIATPENGDIHLGAIFYYGEENWVLWLQGTRWTPETDRDNLHVLAVTSDAVRLHLTLSAGLKPQMITLKPHQTYRLATGEVVEGASVSSAVESTAEDDVSK